MGPSRGCSTPTASRRVSEISPSPSRRTVPALRSCALASGEPGPSGEDLVVATMDMATGAVVELESTHDLWGRPGLSPDGARVAFGNHVADVDGSNLQQIAPADLVHRRAVRCLLCGPGATAVVSRRLPHRVHVLQRHVPHEPARTNSQVLMDIYVVRPDGTGLQRLTTDTVEPPDDTEVGDFGAGFPTWTLDGRIAFSRYPAQSERDPFELWVMDPDGNNTTRIDPSNAAALTDLGCVACPYPGTTLHDAGIRSSAFWIPARSMSKALTFPGAGEIARTRRARRSSYVTCDLRGAHDARLGPDPRQPRRGVGRR